MKSDKIVLRERRRSKLYCKWADYIYYLYKENLHISHVITKGEITHPQDINHDNSKICYDIEPGPEPGTHKNHISHIKSMHDLHRY